MRARLLRFGPTVFAFVGAVAWILWKQREPTFGDEWRYVWYAKNLLAGYFSPSDNIFIGNGPVYPLFLTPFLALGLPVLVPKLFNAVLLAVATWNIQSTLNRYTSPAWAAFGALVFAAMPATVQHLHFTYTETLSLALLSAALNCAVRRPVLAGVLLAGTVLTKVLFGPILLVALVVMTVTRRWSVSLIVAFALCVPWLAYTHSMTGRWFYWASASGQNLYWVATPWPEEEGRVVQPPSGARTLAVGAPRRRLHAHHGPTRRGRRHGSRKNDAGHRQARVT